MSLAGQPGRIRNQSHGNVSGWTDVCTVIASKDESRRDLLPPGRAAPFNGCLGSKEVRGKGLLLSCLAFLFVGKSICYCFCCCCDGHHPSLTGSSFTEWITRDFPTIFQGFSTNLGLPRHPDLCTEQLQVLCLLRGDGHCWRTQTLLCKPV